MDTIETKEQPVTVTPSQQAGQPSCPTCGVPAASGPATASYVYALGRIELRFPTLGAEKEFAQATGRAATKGLTDQQALHGVLSKRENRYLARQICPVFKIKEIETYILIPRDPADIDLLVESLRAEPNPADIDVVIGLRGPIASYEMCNGLLVPIVGFDQIYSCDRNFLIKSIPKPEKVGAKEFAAAAGELLDRIMQMTDNAGATDEHRALNYLAVRYPAIYAKAAEEYAANSSLTAVEVQPSVLSGTRRIVDVIFSYTNRQTDVVEKFFVQVDVHDEYLFLQSKLQRRIDVRLNR